MTDTATEAHRTIRIDYDLPYSPAKVWACLTDSDLLTRWLMPNDFRAEVGHRFTFRTQPIPAAGFDGIVHCEVLVVEPMARLSYSWRGGSIDTVVTWTLREIPTGTLLHLEQDGFGPADMMAFDGLRQGWEKMKTGRILEVLAAL
jgi:uncharacterized protein YndB with AHSA1/START domain